MEIPAYNRRETAGGLVIVGDASKGRSMRSAAFAAIAQAPTSGVTGLDAGTVSLMESADLPIIRNNCRSYRGNEDLV